MPSINVDSGYPSNLKTRKLIARIGELADVFPVRMWLYAAANYPDGRFINHSARDLEQALVWRGKAGKLVSAMLSVGFLDKESDGTLVVHDYAEWSGHLSVFAQRARKAAQARWQKHASSNAQASDKQCPPLTLPTQPNLQYPPNPRAETGEDGEGKETHIGTGAGGSPGNLMEGTLVPAQGFNQDFDSDAKKALLNRMDPKISEAKFWEIIRRPGITSFDLEKQIGRLTEDHRSGKIRSVAGALCGHYKLNGNGRST